jgi:hypothetical protein
MENLNNFIYEKLKINSNSKINSDELNEDSIYNIIIAAYLSIKRLKCWIEGPTFQKKIKYINYNDILNILNETFKYDFNEKDVKVKTGKVWKIVKQYLIPIQNMCNYYNAIVKINDEKITINYKDIDDKYRDILKK